MMGPMQCSCLL